MITPDHYVEWATGQLTEIGVEPHIRDSVMVLLTVFYGQEHTIEQRSQVLDLFDSLAHLHAVTVRSTGPEVWAQARAGAIQVGDQVRVHKDAFSAENPHAIYHNGRQGKIIAIRGGEIWVVYRDGREPPSPDMGLRFPPQLLEKRIR